MTPMIPKDLDSRYRTTNSFSHDVYWSRCLYIYIYMSPRSFKGCVQMEREKQCVCVCVRSRGVAAESLEI